MTGLGSISPPDSDILDNFIRLEPIKLQEMFLFRDNGYIIIVYKVYSLDNLFINI